jgi:thiamine-phosphate pyrophosphorylase
MQLCAITGREQLPSPEGTPAEAEAARRRKLSALLYGWVESGVDFIQLREKDLAPPALLALAGELLAGLDRRQSKLLINLGLSDLLGFREESAGLIALADGIHLPGKPVAEDVERVRQVFRRSRREGLVSLSCHSLEEIHAARRGRADLVFYAPVFEKHAPGAPFQGAAQGLGALRLACEAADGMPVFALGGVTAANAGDCLRAGAAGVAGIRLFQQGGWRLLRVDPPAGSRDRTIYS